MGWEQEFIRGVNLPPAGADEAFGWIEYGIVRAQLVDIKRVTLQFTLFVVDQVSGSAGGISVFGREVALAMTRETPEVDELAAIPFLALRSAHRAIAADPDHPNGYYALAAALSNRGLNMSDEERMVARATALRQFLVRLPPPERYRNSAYLGTATQAAEELSGIYLGRDPSSSRVLGAGMSINLPAFIILRELSLVVIQAGKNMQSVPWSRVAPGQRVVAGPFIYPLDTARDTLLLAEKYLPIDYAENEEERKRKSEELQLFIKAVETQYREATNSYEREREKAPTVAFR